MLSVFVVHIGATLFMTGLIWFVQIVHYPLFRLVGGSYAAYQQAHMRRVTWVVGPLMLLELATATALVFRRPAWLEPWAAGANLGALALIWVSTALLQAPAHGRLLSGFAAADHAALVRTNWLRTFLWTFRSAGLLIVLERLLGRYLHEGI